MEPFSMLHTWTVYVKPSQTTISRFERPSFDWHSPHFISVINIVNKSGESMFLSKQTLLEKSKIAVDDVS